MVSTYSIIIPQLGLSQLTIQAVESLQQTHSADVEIIVVDDGSPLFDRQQIQRRLRGNVRILPLKRRQGVTSAWNRGAELASGQTLIFLNNDTLSSGDWLPALTAPLLDSKCLLTSPESRLEREFPAPHCQFLSGWCLAILRETFFQLGPFDPQFTLYFSDTDLQLQLRRHSDSALLEVPNLPLRHLGHCSTKTLTSRSREWHRDRARFRRKWLSASQD